MDTLFWGPSGWQLLHLIATKYPQDARKYELFFNNIKDVLPCKFCRASTTEFMEKELPLHPSIGTVSLWLYRLHNRVNKKLREQAKTDTNIVILDFDPSFDEVESKYKDLLSRKPKAIAGADFMFTLAYNYPDKPTSDQIEHHYLFWDILRDIFPFDGQKAQMNRYIDKHMIYPALQSRSQYMQWVHGLLSRMCHGKLRSYRGMCQHVGYYKSDCNNPKYRGKTCRRTKDGKYHKVRDHSKTFRITHSRLL